ncbi:sigma factor-like helix-turn-helix DNA-binding protein [Rhodococcus sp. NPDC127528]|uniref:sigma factor-like helix-turn-helix DNA-binding protein n=1 Tax=unclassified Rhodococcus (in: high G+C Gram-positive bacteria) TaxID=192944 RepID=UPI00362B6717
MSHAVHTTSTTASVDGLPGIDELDDAAIASAAGDRHATARVITILRPLVTRLCRANLGSGGAADERAAGICSAVAVAVVTARRGPRLRIVYEATLRALDDASRDRPAVLDGVSRRGREVLTLRLAVGLSVEQTAVALGIAPGRVRVEQHRALTALRTPPDLGAGHSPGCGP